MKPELFSWKLSTTGVCFMLQLLHINKKGSVLPQKKARYTYGDLII